LAGSRELAAAQNLYEIAR